MIPNEEMLSWSLLHSMMFRNRLPLSSYKSGRLCLYLSVHILPALLLLASLVQFRLPLLLALTIAVVFLLVS